MNALAPNNELVITTSMRFHMMTGDFDALDRLASSRLEGVIDGAGYSGSALLFERARWGAVALLGLNDAQGARQLLEKGIPDTDQLDPHPEKIQTLALLARAKSLDGDAAGAADVTAIANRLTDVARSEGWSRGQLSYAAACIAAASGSPEQAVVHLREAVDAGWNDFALADHDPVLADVIQLPAYRALTP